ncbi:MAG: undecaprenyl-diphosphate phosphatase [Candidatus Magnetomorum sp.]|nr:undecaprenyl-diphosphate phosphatase [Candidatus Magnetomorum sp.]
MHETIIPLLLGVVQGLTEFLPVSSSGHLVLLQKLTGIQEPAILFDICLHVGTLMAVILIFYSDIRDMILAIIQLPGQLLKEKKQSLMALIQENKQLKTAFLIIVGTIPTGLMGIFFRKQVDILFGDISLVGMMLIITGIFLGLTRIVPSGGRSIEDITVRDALFLGLIQGFAIIPGISRSGATITAALFLKMDRSLAGRFSFLLSIPSILGALVLELSKPACDPVFSYPMIFAASLVSFAVGFIALKILLRVVDQGKLFYFSPYCIGVGGLTLVLFFC